MPETKNILIIEDDPTICSLLRDFLRDEGYEVTCLDTAIDALKLLEGHKFDLITLDLGLPGMSGNEFLRQIANTGLNIPVVVVSANSEKLIRVDLVKAVVKKPFDLTTLIDTVQNYA